MRKNLVLIVLFAISAVFSGCASAQFNSTGSAGLPSEIDLGALPSAQQYPESDGIVLYENTVYDVDYVPGVGMETYKDVHRIYRIFRNESSFMENYVFFDDKTTFESFSARTVKPDGTSLELSEKDIYHVTVERKNYEYDQKDHVVTYNFPALKKGDILEIKYKSVSRYFYFSDIYFVQDKMPKKYSRFEIKIPNFIFDADFNFSYKTKNISIPEPVLKKGVGDTGDRSYVWESRNIPAFKPEPMMGNDINYRGHVEMQLAYWNTWNGFSRNIYDLTFKPVLDSMSGKDKNRIKSKVAELTAGVNDQLEKIKLLTKFVQSFRYSDTANYFGHAIKPNEIGLILDREYGDCKDHALVLTAMIREIGVKAHPALVAAYDPSGIDPKFVTDIFNHVIVKVTLDGGQTLLLDPTSQYTQFGKLPEMDEDTYMLEMRAKNEDENYKIKLEKTPSSDYSGNFIEKNVKGTIVNGVPSYEVAIKFTGHAAELARYGLENADREFLEKNIRQSLLFYLYDAVISDIKIENLSDTDAPLFLKYTLKPKTAENEAISVAPVIFFNDPVDPNAVYLEKRTKPVVVSSVYSTVETYEMVFDPEKYSVSLPEKLEDSEFSEGDTNSWKIKVESKPGKISLTTAFSQKKKTVKTDSIPSLLKKTTQFSNFQRKMYSVLIIPAAKDEKKIENTPEKEGDK